MFIYEYIFYLSLINKEKLKLIIFSKKKSIKLYIAYCIVYLY